MNYMLKEGDIISRLVKKFPRGKETIVTEYWKVTGEPQKFFHSFSYPVIRCSKTGKEYKDKNGFDISTDKKINDPNCNEWQFVGVANIHIKANIDKGIEIGKMKRRMDYLIGRILSDTKELNNLRSKLVEKEKSK